MKYIVIIDGAGEHDMDFNVLRVEAATPREAVDKVTTSEMGYGKHADGCALVAPEDMFSSFVLNESVRVHAEPGESVSDTLVTAGHDPRFTDVP